MDKQILFVLLLMGIWIVTHLYCTILMTSNSVNMLYMFFDENMDAFLLGKPLRLESGSPDSVDTAKKVSKVIIYNRSGSSCSSISLPIFFLP